MFKSAWRKTKFFDKPGAAEPRRRSLFHRVAKKQAAVFFGKKVRRRLSEARAAVVVETEFSVRNGGKRGVVGGKIPAHIENYAAAGRALQKAARREIKLCGRKISA